LSGKVVITMKVSEARFRLVKTDGSISLSGPVTDTTAFTALDDFKGIQTQIDLSGVVCASLSGMVSLDARLCALKIEYRFINVPFGIFQVIQLCDFCDRVDSFQVAVAKIEPNGETLISEVKTTNDGTGASSQVTQQDGSVALAFRGPSVICPSDVRPYLKNWAQDNFDEAGFWLDYVSFLANCLLQCQQIIASTVSSVTRILRMVDMRVASFATAWKTMELPARQGSWAGEKSILETSKNAEEILQQIADTVLLARQQLGLLLVRFTGDSVENSPVGIFQALKNLENYLPKQAAAGAKIEDSGCSLGDLLMSVEMFSHVRSDLNSSLSQLTQEKLGLVVSQLGIMNPMAENDIEEARAEILAEANVAQTELGDGIVMIQAFDLVRQIMEHRRTEIEIIVSQLSAYEKQETHWTFVRDLLIDKLTSKMVTEHEKKAFEYYLGYLQPPKKEKSAAPGDVELF
jgi:hypothetical protein